MKKEIQLYEMDIANSNIVIDKDFFHRLFTEIPIKTNKPLTSLSLRLATTLLEHLSMIEFKKLPQRKLLACKLKASQQAINDSLIQLEDTGFIIRRISELESVIWADEEKGKKISTEYAQKKDEEKKARRFSDEFIINYNYNISQEDVKKELKKVIERILSPNVQISEEILDLIENSIQSKK